MPDEASGGPRRPAGIHGVPLDAPQMQISSRNPQLTGAITALLFLLGLAAFALFGAAYFQAWDNDWLGGTLGGGMLCFGAGLVCWGKYLMPRGPFEEERHLMAVDPEQRADVVADFAGRGKVAITRRGYIVGFMGAAAGVFGIVLAFPLIRSLGPRLGNLLTATKWRKGSYLTTINNQRVNVDDIPVGGIVTVFPPDDVGGAYSQTLLIHVQASGQVPTPYAGREDWTDVLKNPFRLILRSDLTLIAS